jgi:hypothetical protein
MKIPKLEFDCDTNSAHKITEVALANGLNPEVKDEFYNYVSECVDAHIEYNKWEDYMREDI